LAATSKPNERQTPSGMETDMTNTCARVAGIIAAVALQFAAPCAWAQAESVSAEEAREIAGEAYIYAYQLVLMDVTRMNLRLYWPKPDVLDGSWPPPPVKRVN
jgi:hypothetical protein